MFVPNLSCVLGPFALNKKNKWKRNIYVQSLKKKAWSSHRHQLGRAYPTRNLKRIKDSFQKKKRIEDYLLYISNQMDLGEPIAKLNPLFILKFRHKTKFIFQWAKLKPNNLSLSYT